MSVFEDFQRMWMKRFPENSLSNEWEDDVRASLSRHKQKVHDLSKELEQEMLYVEYLDRLLKDVEEFRRAGGDPAIPIQTTTSSSSSASQSNVEDQQHHSIDSQGDKSDDIGNSTNNEHTSEVRVYFIFILHLHMTSVANNIGKYNIQEHIGSFILVRCTSTLLFFFRFVMLPLRFIRITIILLLQFAVLLFCYILNLRHNDNGYCAIESFSIRQISDNECVEYSYALFGSVLFRPSGYELFKI